jgi:hypothetical protein
MIKGAQNMAVVTYTLGKDGAGKPTISPDPSAVEFRPGDYVLFTGVPGAPAITVRVQMPLTAQFLGCVTAGEPVVIQIPELDSDGNIIVAFSPKGGDSSGDPGFPYDPGGN